MHRRPKLKEAIQVLSSLATTYNNQDAATALQDYYSMKTTDEFLAARMVIEIVDHFYHLINYGEASNA